MNKIKFYVLRGAHTLLCAVLTLAMFLYMGLLQIMKGSEFANSLNKYVWIPLTVLGMIVSVLISVIGLVYLNFVVGLYYFPETRHRIKAKDSAASDETSSEEERKEKEQDEMAKLPRIPLSKVGVRCVSEKCDLLSRNDHVWDIVLYFSLINLEPTTVVIFDMHAHVYSEESHAMPVASVLAREEIVLWEDNSIMFSGKSYRLEPKEVFPMRMSLRLTCEKPEGTWMTVFGLFFDYFRAEGDSSQIRFPSDSIFVFQNHSRGHLVYVCEKNLASYWERHRTSLSGFALCNKFEKSLHRHLRSAFYINGSSHA